MENPSATFEVFSAFLGQRTWAWRQEGGIVDMIATHYKDYAGLRDVVRVIVIQNFARKSRQRDKPVFHKNTGLSRCLLLRAMVLAALADTEAWRPLWDYLQENF